MGSTLSSDSGPGDLMETAIYTQQRPEREDAFTGKTSVIRQQFDQYEPRPAANLGQRKEWLGTSFGENNKAKIVGNYASFDVVQYRDRPQRAGMSMIHLLAVPVDRIVNALDLTPNNVDIIDHMIELFEKLWAQPQKRKEIIDHQLKTIITRGKDCDPRDTQLALKHYQELEADAYKLTTDDFYYGLHLAPDASANDLHLHIIAAPAKFRQYSTSQHDKKTKDAIEVRDFIIRNKGKVL